METLPVRYENQIESLISQAIDKNVPVETMERLLAMAKEIKADRAKEAFDEAMSELQSECPIIVNSKEVRNKEGKLQYKYAPIDTIVVQVKEVLRKYGFSYSIQTVTYEDAAEVICVVKHKLGHSESASMKLPFITKTSLMNDAHQVEGTITVCKRLAFCNAFGILTSNYDYNNIEQKEEENPNITEGQVDVILGLLNKANYTEDQLCKGAKVTDLKELTRRQATTIILNLEKLTKGKE